MKKWPALIGLVLCPALIAGQTALSVSQRILDRNGVPIREFLSNNHTYHYFIPLGEISPWIIVAAVATEDKRFYQHNGVDTKAVLRALWRNTTSGEVLSGASTITQQLVRNIEPRPKTWWGKTREAWQAKKWENEHTKEEILEDYFNRVELGNLTQGIQTATQFYFGIDAKEVSLAQAALLVGLIKSPTHYNPLKYKARALQRRTYVLKRMLEENFIDEEMYKIAQAEPLVLSATSRPFEAPHFAQLVHSLVSEGKTIIRTPLDKDLQLYIEKIIKTHLQKLREENVTNAAVVVLDNANSDVLAYVGSADFYDSNNNGEVDGARALRQPGSSLKPFVYGLAFEKNLITPAYLLSDEDTFFEDGFRPRNYDKNFHGLVSVREALACSYNIPVVKVAEKIGAPTLLDMLRSTGLTELGREAEYYGLGIALGNGEIQLLHLTNAYAALARGGIYKPLTLTWEPHIQTGGKSHQIFSPETAYLISHILSDNQARSSAFGLNSALSVPFEMAAKTGTSKDYKDNFTFAYTSRWTIGVWVGNFDATPMHQVSGVTGAAPIMHEIAIYLNENYPSRPFVRPKGIITAHVCSQSGLLAGPTCTHTQEELFSMNNLPVKCNGKHTKNSEDFLLVSPTNKSIYKWDPTIPPSTQKLLWESSCTTKVCRWVLDGKKHSNTSCHWWWPLQVGKHQLTVWCGKNHADISFEVLP